MLDWVLVVVLLKELSWEVGGRRPLIDTARTLGLRVVWVMKGKLGWWWRKGLRHVLLIVL